jgi:beta-lactam-binding protein with PASTA domain
LDGLRATGTIFRRLAIVLILGATFAASAMVTVYALFHSGQVRVPNVVGMTEEEARRTIERAGLAFKTRRQHFDAATAAGAVSEQDPAADYPVKAGFQVKVDISKGPNPTGEDEPVDIPIGPNVPQDETVKNANTNKKKKPTNTNAANSNAAANANRPAPATNSEKTPADSNKAPSETKKPEAGDDAQPKPKPESAKPETPRPPPSR